MGQLKHARRNRYYYGKLMDVDHFVMEQRYVVDQQRQLNRLILGPGVVSGLGVSVVRSGSKYGLRLAPGVAIDGLGRLIVVPDEVDLVPLRLTDEYGVPVIDGDDPLPADLVVRLCYCECETDIGPVLAPDPCCDGTPDHEAGTMVESFTVTVREGRADDVALNCEVGDLLRRGRLHDALCALVPDEPAAADPEGCVTLANVTVGPGGRLTVESCGPRTVVPTNRLLLSLVSCLAMRIEECCGPTPTPPDQPLAVGSVTYIYSAGPTLPLKVPTEKVELPRAREPIAFEVEFVNAQVDQTSVVVDSTVVVTCNGARYIGDVSWPASNRMRYSAAGAFPIGDYEVILRGDATAITSVGTANSPPQPLDGDAGPAWPSGDGNPGGNYAFAFSVVV